MAKIQEQSFEEFRNAMLSNKEGIVLLGCGGDLNEWVEGVTHTLEDNEIIYTIAPEKVFSSFTKLVTTGGRTDLAMCFKDGAKIEIGKMAIWRLQFGDCSWISDYLVNYASQHGYDIKEDEQNIWEEEEEDDEY